MIRINVGKPVQGENFFDRNTERRRLWELLHDQHVLLLSPRRVGKTSLMYRLATEAEARKVDDQGHDPSSDDVDEVFAALLSPAKRSYFDYWSQRLGDELGTPDAERAHEILTACASDPSGVDEATVQQLLVAHVPDERRRTELRRYLLDVLQSDGYLIQDDGRRYRFHSELLLQVWLRSFGP